MTGRYERRCGRTVAHEAHRWGVEDNEAEAWCDGQTPAAVGVVAKALDAVLKPHGLLLSRQIILSTWEAGGCAAVRAFANDEAERALRVGWPAHAAAWLSVAVWAYEQDHPEVGHVTTVYTGTEVGSFSNFVVLCSCGHRSGVASLRREFAEEEAARHVLEAITPDTLEWEDEPTAEHTPDFALERPNGPGTVRWQQVTLLIPFDPFTEDAPESWGWECGMDPRAGIQVVGALPPADLAIEEVRP